MPGHNTQSPLRNDRQRTSTAEFVFVATGGSLLCNSEQLHNKGCKCGMISAVSEKFPHLVMLNQCDLRETISGDVVLRVFGEVHFHEVAGFVQQGAAFGTEVRKVQTFTACFILFRK